MGFIICTKRISRYLEEKCYEEFKSRSLSYVTRGKFLSDLKKEFGGGNDEIMKVAELKKVEQKNKIIEKFIQKFKRK